MNLFQISIVGVFITALILGTLIFAGVIPGFRAPQGGTGGTVVWWGTIDEEKMGSTLETIHRDHKDDFTLEYVEKNPATIESDLVEALALGRGPDLVTLSSDMLLRQSAKLQPISYETISKQSFKNTFIFGTHTRDWELFFDQEGVLGWPLYVDPLVLYYNQDLIANAKLAGVPQFWNDLATVLKLLALSDSQGNLTQGAIALGAFNNIIHAKDALALLLIQAGNPIVARRDGVPTVTLKDTLGFNKPPAGEAIAFFLRFTDPANSLYSWNSSEPEARDSFLRGRLALYLGFGSERTRLAAQNPQLNFFLSLPPQRPPAPSSDSASRQVTIGRFSFLAIPRGAKNPNTAYQVASLLSGAEISRLISNAAGLPPARNDLLSPWPTDPEEAVLYQAAVIARDWLDPAPDKTQAIFRQLVEAISLGRLDPNRTITDAQGALEALLPKNESR